MTTIDKLIHDALAQRRSVVLPGAGTLEVKRRGAQKISDTQIMPPQNVVAFTPDEITEGTQNVVGLIAADRGVSEPDAMAAYGAWLEERQRNDGVIEIESVGKTGNDGFAVDEQLHAALNPAGEVEPVTVEAGKRGSRRWVWILAALVAAAIIAAVCCWKKGCFGGSGGFGGRAGKPAVETVVATPATPAVDSTTLAAAETARAAAAVAEASAAARFHVIAGAFAIESNADNFVARIKRLHPELTPMKIVNPIGSYNMVSIFQTSSRPEANRKMNRYSELNEYMWILDTQSK